MLRPIAIITSGGLENGGGIGRMIGYMLEAWKMHAQPQKFTVIDSRGPGRKDLAQGFFALALLRLFALGLSSRPLVHVHLAGRGSTLRKVIVVHLAALLRLPIVLHLHDFNYAAFLDSLPPVTLGPIRSMFRQAGAVVVLGRIDQQTVVDRLGVAPNRVRIIPNCVPEPLDKSPARTEQAGVVNILFLGDPSRRKGVHDLIDALGSSVMKAGGDLPPWRAVIAGGGKELSGFEAMAAQAGLSDRVEFPGWLNLKDAQALLARCDILVLPSYGEGLAMAVLEGMSYEKCVVCTPVGALSEVIEHNVSGLLVSPGHPLELAQALRLCASDASLRRRLGEGAFARYLQAYNVKDYPGRMLAAYGSAIALATRPKGPSIGGVKTISD